MDVDVKEFPAQTLAAVEHRGAYPEIGSSFEKLGAVLAEQRLWGQVGDLVGVYYDDPSEVPEAELRSHAGVLLPEGVAVPEGLEAVALAAGPAAVFRLVGPYSGLPGAWQSFYGTWLPTSGRIPSDAPSYEVYRNSPHDTAAEDLITDLVMPLA